MGFDDVALADGLNTCLVRAKGMAALINAAAEADSVLEREALVLLHWEACELVDCLERAWGLAEGRLAGSREADSPFLRG